MCQLLKGTFSSEPQAAIYISQDVLGIYQIYL